MAKLEAANRSQLLSAFHDAERPKAVKRLVMAIAYLDGVPVSRLSDRYDIPRSTIYAWFDRFEAEPIEDAIRDENRPGRPPDLEPREFVQLASDIAGSPEQHGFEETKWTAKLLQTRISESYGVSYSEGHARRLLRQLGKKSD